MQRLLRSTITSLPALLLAAPVLAAVEGEAAHGESAGLPQLDPSTYPSQIFWLAVSFLLLFWLFRTKALPRVGAVLETRQSRIAADLDRATKLREEAEAALVRYQQVVADAQGKASGQIRETRERLIAENSARQAELDKTLAAKVADAEKRIRAARDAAMADLNSVAVEVAQAATSRLIGKQVSREAAEAALASVVKEAA
jgi:F-type H+-transporting ATPase subunit b